MSQILKVRTIWSGTMEAWSKLEFDQFIKFLREPNKKTRKIKLETVDTMNIRTLNFRTIATIFLRNDNVLIAYTSDIHIPIRILNRKKKARHNNASK